jgi:hypothetical protein
LPAAPTASIPTLVTPSGTVQGEQPVAAIDAVSAAAGAAPIKTNIGPRAATFSRPDLTNEEPSNGAERDAA